MKNFFKQETVAFDLKGSSFSFNSGEDTFLHGVYISPIVDFTIFSYSEYVKSNQIDTMRE